MQGDFLSASVCLEAHSNKEKLFLDAAQGRQEPNWLEGAWIARVVRILYTFTRMEMSQTVADDGLFIDDIRHIVRGMDFCLWDVRENSQYMTYGVQGVYYYPRPNLYRVPILTGLL